MGPRWMRTFAVGVAMLILGAAQAHGGTCTVVDQRNLTSSGNIVVSDSQVPGQSFVAGLAGQLVGIEVAPLLGTVSPNTIMFLDLFDGSGQLLGTASMAASEFPPGAGTVPAPLQDDTIGPGYFDLTNLGVLVEPGTALLFRLRHDQIGVCDQATFVCIAGGFIGYGCWDDSDCPAQMRAGESLNTYPSGTEVCSLDGGPMVSDPSFDLAFKTFIAEPCPTVTPPPAPTVTLTTNATETALPSATPTRSSTETPTSTTTAVETPAPTTTATVVPVCAVAPEMDCRRPIAANRSTLAIKDRPGDKRDLLTWKWTKGEATLKSEFGDPTTDTGYVLCIYDETGGVPSRVLALSIPPGDTCAGRPCWKLLRQGFKYTDKDGTPSGVTHLALREGLEGAAQITMKARGVNLPMSGLPLNQNARVIVQLRNDLGVCWGADFSAPALKNEQIEFRDKSD